MRTRTSWAQKPKNQALMARVAAAHFVHFSEFGVSYHSCRFCGTWARDNEDLDHGSCPLPRLSGNVCRGLWKYAVRHYLCSDCRKDVQLGLHPAKSRGRLEDFSECPACDEGEGEGESGQHAHHRQSRRNPDVAACQWITREQSRRLGAPRL